MYYNILQGITQIMRGAEAPTHFHSLKITRLVSRTIDEDLSNQSYNAHGI